MAAADGLQRSSLTGSSSPARRLATIQSGRTMGTKSLTHSTRHAARGTQRAARVSVQSAGMLNGQRGARTPLHARNRRQQAQPHAPDIAHAPRALKLLELGV